MKLALESDDLGSIRVFRPTKVSVAMNAESNLAELAVGVSVSGGRCDSGGGVQEWKNCCEGEEGEKSWKRKRRKGNLWKKEGKREGKNWGNKGKLLIFRNGLYLMFKRDKKIKLNLTFETVKY